MPDSVYKLSTRNLVEICDNSQSTDHQFTYIKSYAEVLLELIGKYCKIKSLLTISIIPKFQFSKKEMEGRRGDTDKKESKDREAEKEKKKKKRGEIGKLVRKKRNVSGKR